MSVVFKFHTLFVARQSPNRTWPVNYVLFQFYTPAMSEHLTGITASSLLPTTAS